MKVGRNVRNGVVSGRTALGSILAFSDGRLLACRLLGRASDSRVELGHCPSPRPAPQSSVHPDDQFTPGRAIFVGGSAGVALATTGVLFFLVPAFQSMPFLNTPFEVVLLSLGALPGVVLAGSVFAFPTAALLVATMTWLARRWRPMDSFVSWVIAGVFASSPVAWFFHQIDSSSFGVWLAVSILVIGAASALAAWWARRLPLANRYR